MLDKLLHAYHFFLPCNIFSQNYSFTNINEKYGISKRSITSVAQDNDGFIWAASPSCILRISSSDSHIFKLPYSRKDVMQVKLAYNKGILIAATQNGQIFKLNRIKNRFEKWFNISPQLGNKNWLTNIFINSDGKIWISTSNGIFIWTDNKTIKHLSDCKGTAFIEKIDNNSLFAIEGSSIYIINLNNYKQKKIKR